MTPRLVPEAVVRALRDLEGWTFAHDALQKMFLLRDFDHAIAFVNRVADAARQADHHPDIALSWNEVTIRSWSHDVGGVSERDVALARTLDALATLE